MMLKQQPANPGRHALDGAFWVTIAQAMMLPTGLATVAYLTRRLGPAGYGNYAVVLTLLVWMEFAVNAVFNRTTIKMVSSVSDWARAATSILHLTLIVSLAVFVAIYLAADAVAAGLGQPEMAGWIRLAAVDLPIFAMAQAHLNIVLGLGRYRQQALVAALRWVVRLALIVLFVELGMGVRGAILGCVGTSVVELLIARLICHPPLWTLPQLPGSELWKYALPLFIAAVSQRLLEGMDLIALKAMGTTDEIAGQFAAALNMALLPGMAAAAVASVLIASLSSTLAQGQQQQANQMARQALRMTFAVLPLGAVVAGASTEITTLFFGQAYLQAGQLLQILIIAGMGKLVMGIALATLIAAGKPKWTAAITLPLVPLALGGYLLVIPTWDAAGAAAVTAVASTFGAILSVAGMLAIWQVTLPTRTLLRSAAVTLAIYAAASVWTAPGLWAVPKVMVLAIMAAAGSVILGEFQRDAYKLGLRFIRR